jgi:GNAT superfamily N-acetyltransferase
MRIRPMTAADAPLVADLATQLGYPTSAEEAADRLSALDGLQTALVADENGRAIGWVQVALVTSLVSGLKADVAGLVVDENHRSGGIGAALLEAAEAWARDRGAAAMLVRTRVARERAHRFYGREGYDLVKTSHVFEKRLV